MCESQLLFPMLLIKAMKSGRIVGRQVQIIITAGSTTERIMKRNVPEMVAKSVDLTITTARAMDTITALGGDVSV